MEHLNGLPEAQGLYSPDQEHDSCGVGFVVDIKGRKSHDTVAQAIEVLINLTHRGACGCDPDTGDGAGVLIQIPHEFLKSECNKIGITLPEPCQYGAGIVFLSPNPEGQQACQKVLEEMAAHEGQEFLGW